MTLALVIYAAVCLGLLGSWLYAGLPRLNWLSLTAALVLVATVVGFGWTWN